MKLREIYNDMKELIEEGRQARKKFPRRYRQELLRDEILRIALRCEDESGTGIYGYLIMAQTNLSTGRIYLAFAQLENEAKLRRIDSGVGSLPPRITYRLTPLGREAATELMGN